VISIVIACAAWLLPRSAHAHPAPAEAPDFGMPPCISVVDVSKQSSIEIAYTLAMDDTAFGPLDIPMPDAKTHQFFAFSGAMFSDATAYQIAPFDPAVSDPIELPLWINENDVMRAATASADVTGAMFSAADIPQDEMLAKNSALAGRFMRITADDARVPITLAQAKTSVHWDLAGVAAGAYTFAAYIFSPPYNGWAPRPGLLKVKDAQHDLPAAVIDPINDFVFSYQGRKVSACVDAPSGTQLAVAVRFEEHPELGYIDALAPRDASTGPVALCVRNPMPELSGSLRVRFTLTAPDGTTTEQYSPDHVTALSGQGTCVESDTVCCDFEPAQQAEDPHAMGAAGMGGKDVDEMKADHAGCSVVHVSGARARTSALALLLWFVVTLRPRRGRARALAVLLMLLAACSERTPVPQPAPPKPGTPARAEPISPTHPHAMSLQPEMAALGAARFYREQGKPEQALVQLDVLAQRYPDPALPAERAAERAATLCALGRTQDAKRFLGELTQLAAPPALVARANAACAPPP
jgi:hypothetical protein